MRIAIIGAGAAGLSAAKHSLDLLGQQFENQQNEILIFEQTGNVGGTWNYTDKIGHEENGIPVHSSMYKGLRTNLPKELMSFEDFPYPDQIISYISQEEVIAYISNYAKHFKINKQVQFYHRVIKVEPYHHQWLIEAEDLKLKTTTTHSCDSVIVCNGHYMVPRWPKITGLDQFSGRIKHSHDYRNPDSYRDKVVLIIGAGPSGLDISQQIASVARRVVLSHKLGTTSEDMGRLVHSRPLAIRFDYDRVYFEDGTSEVVQDVLVCTGYHYQFPFLSPRCGVKVEDNYVSPLYKHVISIENPTLAFIGLPIAVCPFPLFDIQVRFFLSTLSGHFKLPTKEEMRSDLQRIEDEHHKSDVPKRFFHKLAERQGEYFDELAETAAIKKIPAVISRLFMAVRCDRNRDDCFKIIDDETWQQVR